MISGFFKMSRKSKAINVASIKAKIPVIVLKAGRAVTLSNLT